MLKPMLRLAYCTESQGWTQRERCEAEILHDVKGTGILKIQIMVYFVPFF